MYPPKPNMHSAQVKQQVEQAKTLQGVGKSAATTMKALQSHTDIHTHPDTYKCKSTYTFAHACNMFCMDIVHPQTAHGNIHTHTHTHTYTHRDTRIRKAHTHNMCLCNICCIHRAHITWEHTHTNTQTAAALLQLTHSHTWRRFIQHTLETSWVL